MALTSWRPKKLCRRKLPGQAPSITVPRRQLRRFVKYNLMKMQAQQEELFCDLAPGRSGLGLAWAGSWVLGKEHAK